MKIKYLIIVFCLIVLAVNAETSLDFSREKSDSVGSVVTDSIANFRIKDIRQDPYPVSPGQFVDIYFNIDNLGGDIKNPRFDLVLQNPFSLDNSGNNQNAIATISSGQKITLRYRVSVDGLALPGDYEIEFRAYADSGSYYPYFFKIKIDDVTTDFDVALQEVNKEGVSIAISNIGKNIANSITVKLDNQQDFDLLGYSSYIIGNLNNGDYTIINALLAPKEDKVGNLNLNLDISYTDILGNRRNIAKQIQIQKTIKIDKGFKELSGFVVYGQEDQNQSSGSRLFIFLSIALACVVLGTNIYYRRKLKYASEKDEE